MTLAIWLLKLSIFTLGYVQELAGDAVEDDGHVGVALTNGFLVN